MKLRIRGNTLRLRLTQPEVERFGATGRVEERIRFGPGERLTYTLEASDAVGHLAAHYEEGRIAVRIPAASARAWVESDQVSLESAQPIEGDEALEILIEKDFQCLHKPPAEKEADAFPHPLAG